MSVDWTIVAAQIGNFLVLVWLLKRFLYRPILDGIDAREAAIAEQMREAALGQEKAAAAESDFRDQLTALQADQAAVTARAKLATAAERDTLLSEARERMEVEHKQWTEQLQDKGSHYLSELHQVGATTLLALTRRALQDLADETLEQRIVAHMAARLRPMRTQLCEAAGSVTDALATTRDPLPADARKQLTADLADILADVRLSFETDPTQSPGLILRLGGAQLSWTVETYIDEFESMLKDKLAAGSNVRVAADGTDTTPLDFHPGELLQALRDSPAPQPTLNEIGHVSEIADGIATVTGIARAVCDELLQFASGTQGIVLDLEPDRLGVALLGASDQVSVGEDVRRTRKVVSVQVGEELLGRVVDALGNPRDGNGPLGAVAMRPVEAQAPDILSRVAISRPLATGITAIDAAVPVGLGQRELIIGDRQTGKTSIAVDTILNQRATDVVCVYCAIGQRGDAVAKVIGALNEGGMMARTIVIAAGDEDPPGLSFIAPYAAMSMAEAFARQGRDVLVVMDDLTHHARAYRELSLLLRRPPGREAFPGDIFYVHARLLERAGNFAARAGGGSITALPIIETQAENLSAYIPTNLISITDGQIYLAPRLVQKNQFPAVDLGLSVSRVGGKAQSVALRHAAGNLRVTLSQFEELEDFARFGTRLDDATRARLARGAAMRTALRQPERAPIPAVAQVAVLTAAAEGLFDGLADPTVAMATVRAAAVSELGDLAQRIAANEAMTDADRERIGELARDVLATSGQST